MNQYSLHPLLSGRHEQHTPSNSMVDQEESWEVLGIGIAKMRIKSKITVKRKGSQPKQQIQETIMNREQKKKKNRDDDVKNVKKEDQEQNAQNKRNCSAEREKAAAHKDQARDRM